MPTCGINKMISKAIDYLSVSCVNKMVEKTSSLMVDSIVKKVLTSIPKNTKKM